MPGPSFFALFGLYTVNDFLRPEECRMLCEEIRTAARTAATVRKSGTYTVDARIRSTNWVEVSAASADLIRGRLLNLKPKLEAHFRVALTGCQPPQFLAYRIGDFYRAHRDSARDAEAPEVSRQRKVSAVVFLNEGEYEGGSLAFFDLVKHSSGRNPGLPLEAHPGLLIAFRSDLLHEVAPVTGGERYTIACWYD